MVGDFVNDRLLPVLPVGSDMRVHDVPRDRSRTQFRPHGKLVVQVLLFGDWIHPQRVGNHALSEPPLVHKQPPGLRTPSLLTTRIFHQNHAQKLFAEITSRITRIFSDYSA